jgi:uncharacterized protein YraI
MTGAKFTLSLSLLTLLAAACSLSVSPSGKATPTEVLIITATLPPTLTPYPTAAPTQTATFAPVEGSTTTQVNVRSQPSLEGKALGLLNPGDNVQIVGTDADEKWLQILYPDGPGGKGWIVKDYVHLTGELDVPVIGGPKATVTATQATGTPSTPSRAASSTPYGPSGVIQQIINVRNGPGTEFDALGTLAPETTVRLTGKNQDATWLQIEYESGPEDRGWLAAGYVQASGVDELPIVGEGGTVVGTGTPTKVPPTPTATLVAASEDDDSMGSPAASVTFAPSASRSISYSSDVSSPTGDPEDWIEFTPASKPSGQATTINASLSCEGNGSLTVELWRDGKPVSNWGGLTCGQYDRPLHLTSGQAYLIRLRAKASSGSELLYVTYTLTIGTPP